MICPECNTMNPNSIKKCIKCGAKLEKSKGGGAVKGSGSGGPKLKKKEKPRKSPKVAKAPKKVKDRNEDSKSRMPMLIILLVLLISAYFLYTNKQFVMDYYNDNYAVNDSLSTQDSTEEDKKVGLYYDVKTGRSKGPRDTTIYKSLSDAKKAQRDKKKRTYNKRIYYSRDNKKMILVPGHKFKMGSDKGSELETPAHTARVIDFYMDETEVTNAQFKNFLEATGYKPKGSLSHLRDRRFNKDNMPVVDVAYDDAVAYAEWAEKRLPTEIEWEAAAKDTANLEYPTGNDMTPEQARYGLNITVGSPVPVKSYKPNSIGLYDLAGNVSEWVHGVIYPYPGNDDFNRNFGKARVPRGGSWMSSKEDCKTYRRAILDISKATGNIGFRCAISKNEVIELINK